MILKNVPKLGWQCPRPHEPLTKLRQLLMNNREMAAYNSRIILSPSMHTSDGDSGLEMHPLIEGCSAVLNAKLLLRTENKRRLLEQRSNRYRQDHYKACGGALNPIPAEPFNFLGLPIEIRYKVYGIVLGCQVTIKQDSSESNGPIDVRINNVSHPSGPIDVRIFAVSRQVYAEALEVFYQVNTFAVWIQEPGPLPLFVARSTGIHPPRPTDLIRRMHIWILFPVLLDEPPRLEQIQTLCLVLSRCKNLKELGVTTSIEPPRYSPEYQGTFDELLECFTVIRGVGNVVFTDLETLRELRRTNCMPVETLEQAKRMKRIMEGKRESEAR